jgi:hypothetical protein
MNKITILHVILVLCSCQKQQNHQAGINLNKITLEEAEKLVQLPFSCVTQEFPNKLNQVIGDTTDLKSPKELHPAFYGCFDWHSAVHGHWSLVELLRMRPELKEADSIKSVLATHLTKENILKEVEYFERDINSGYERMYGWAWTFKLSQTLYEWEDSLGKELHKNLIPLTPILKEKFDAFIPELVYPIRVGEHTNTAFALNLMYEYAESVNDKAFVENISKAAKRFYTEDSSCPLEWEPSGYDFLSPCLEEAVLMQKILEKEQFDDWIASFLPQLQEKTFNLKPAKVSDRSDGKLVHLDGLNFSRAWNLFKLAENPNFEHLKPIAVEHYNAAYPNLVGDGYEGGHWLASFAIYAAPKPQRGKHDNSNK